VVRIAAAILLMSHMALPAQLEEVSGWLKLPAGWRLRGASGVAVDSKGRIYVAHRGEHPLFVAGPDGGVLRAIAEDSFPATRMILPTGKPAGSEPMYWLHGLRLDGEDNVWVTEIGRDVVLKLSPDGRLLLTLGTPGRSGKGPDLSIGKGSKPDEFELPHGIAVGPDGKIYVAERLNHRVQIFDPDGRFLAQWPDLPGADSIRIAPDGWAYVGSADQTRTFQRVSLDGRRREVVATRAEMGYPHTFCFDREGNLYTADPLSHTVRKFRLRRAGTTGTRGPR
jgi:sugar lactone lactonase YvrE